MRWQCRFMQAALALTDFVVGGRSASPWARKKAVVTLAGGRAGRRAGRRALAQLPGAAVGLGMESRDAAGR